VVTARTWIGGGNNQATNPNDWSPTGAPEPGDSLTMTHGVMDISGNDLAGDTLSLTGNDSKELDSRAAARLNLSTFGQGDVDVHVHGTLRLNAQALGFFQSHVGFSGGTIHFIGTSQFAGTTTIFDDNLVGSGTINVSHATNGGGGSELMELKGAVAGGLTFNIESGGPPVRLQLDDPAKFHGTINLPPDFEIGGWPL
jgi:hypothetical protein